MERVKQYLTNASECRAAAQRTPAAEAKAHFLKMAEMWEGLARERKAIIEQGLLPPGTTDQLA